MALIFSFEEYQNFGKKFQKIAAFELEVD